MIKTIFWDFDGVILDSMPVRDFGFRQIFKAYDEKQVQKLMNFHAINGGLSRYVKIHYFYEEILGQSITKQEVQELADEFSSIMRAELIKQKYLIDQTMDFIKQNYDKYNFHIVSGSDEKELRFLCKKLKIDKYFSSIHGSPTHKNELVKNLLAKHKYNSHECILIGDSINDYEAARVNDMDFYGFNNEKLKEISKIYIEDFSKISLKCYP